MTPVSGLVNDERLAFRFRQREAQSQPDALLLLLHGVGGDASQLAALVERLPVNTIVVLPRAPKTFRGGGYRWFDVEFTATGSRIDAHEADESRRQLIRFIEQLQAMQGISAKRTLIAGFSQGGIMSASVALTRPDIVAGFALLSGRILPEIADEIPVGSEALKQLDALITHGDADHKLPVSLAHQSSETLHALGVPHKLQAYAAGHTLNDDMQRDLAAWVRRRLDSPVRGRQPGSFHQHT